LEGPKKRVREVSIEKKIIIGVSYMGFWGGDFFHAALAEMGFSYGEHFVFIRLFPSVWDH